MSALYELPFTTLTSEPAGPVPIEGTLPDGLRGTLLRNGPGVLEVGDDGLNFFDAHGCVVGLTLADGTATLRSRIVPTALLAAERAAGRLTKRRLFTNLPSRWRNLAALDLGNGVAHDVYAWAGRVIASNDPGHHALDARTLADRGPERWAGLVPPKDLMCPMPRVDPASGRLVVWTVKVGGVRPDVLTFLELDAEGRVAHRAPPTTLGSSPAVVHGHAFSARWYAVVELPGRLDVLSALWGRRTVFESLRWPDTGCTLVLVAREGTAQVRVPLGPEVGAVFHLANAHDDGDALVVDAVVYPVAPPFGKLGPAGLRARLGVDLASDAPGPRLVRFRIDTAAGRVTSSSPVPGATGEAPAVDPRFDGRPHRHVFLPLPHAAGDEPTRAFYGFFHGLGRVDTSTGVVQSWNAGADALVSPPAFVPRAADAPEGDGWLLAWVTRGSEGRTEVVVLDTADLGAGPVARVPLGVLLPGVSHTRFAPDVDLRG